MRAEPTKFVGQASADVTDRAVPVASEPHCCSDFSKDDRARELLAFMAEWRLVEHFSLRQKPSSSVQISTD
jgi:hypothetical protein